MPKLKEILFGKKAKTKQVSTQTPEQKEMIKLINQGLKSGKGPFSDLFGNFNAEDFEEGVVQPELKNFQENILPQLQEKFIAGNQALGSGMQRAETKAGADLQSKLAQLKYQAKQQQNQNKMAGLNTSLGIPGVQNITYGGTTGALAGLAQGAASGLASMAGAGIAG